VSAELVFVGTSDAFGAGGRRQSAIVARGRSGSVLLDCGATTTGGLAALEIERDEIDAIVVSHFHGDHFGGIPHFLLAAQYEDRRRRPLEIGGPPEIEARVRRLAEAMGHGLEGRPLDFAIRFRELRPGARHEVGPVSLRAFETRHQLESHPHGYRVELGGASLAYSGDTGWFDELPRRCAGVDLLVCECTNHSRELDFHLCHEQLALHQEDFDCGRMLLTHLGAEMSDRRGRCDFETADDGLRVRL